MLGVEEALGIPSERYVFMSTFYYNLTRIFKNNILVNATFDFKMEWF